MTKEKRIKGLLYILLFIPLFIISEVKALTFDNFEVTWYYRNKSNESQLLNVLKQEDVPLYASTNEYVNGYTTRVEQTFTKQIQYIVNYQLQMWFSPEQELNYRSDTLQRIINYSYVDSDFKILNTVANESWNRSSGTGDTVLTINVSIQVLALNDTNAIRFGVYTNNNISIGFYNHSDYINYYLVNNISIEENANATIIDQNNQIINGQNSLQNSITNTEDSINQNIDDMEQSIVDSNKETQDVIKDQFNTCRDSYNLFDKNNAEILNALLASSSIKLQSSNSEKTIIFKVDNNTTYTIQKSRGKRLRVAEFTELPVIGSTGFNFKMKESSESITYTTTTGNYIAIGFYVNTDTLTLQEMLDTIQIVKGSTAKPYEPYGEEICSNKIDETNDALNNISGTLTDSSAPNTSGLENSAGWLPAGPLDSVLNLPLSLFNALTTNLNKSCNPINIPLPFVNKNITLPCINTLYNQIGITSFLSWIGVIVSGLMLYTYLLKLYKWIEDRISLNETHNVDSWGGL